MSVASFKALANEFVTSTFADFALPYTFETPTKTPDNQGGYTVTWAEFKAVSGFVKPTSGKELTLDDHIKTENLKKFSFEYVAGLKNDMRILFNGKYYNIHSIKNIQESTIWIDVIASESVAT
jgi:SPP1 family predicted phage head-tail adaptor